jgi:molybdopterin-guanine dinucleotide biosynthesis protein
MYTMCLLTLDSSYKYILIEGFYKTNLLTIIAFKTANRRFSVANIIMS